MPLVPWAYSVMLPQQPLDLAALAVHLRAVLVGEFDEVVVEDLARLLGPIADLAAAHAVGLDRDDRSAPSCRRRCCARAARGCCRRRASEVIPVVHLVLHFGHARLARAEPDVAAVPVRPQEDDLAQLAVVDRLDVIEVVGLVAALEADADLEPFSSASLLVSMSRRKPAASVQHGFSMNTCFPA